ncbi:MAG: cyclic nucleotide-binding domain-containing protein, partial [Rubrivivax sp.]|nr:cyclic nucleotide-binding domain-containing protein [Rubrivivax sp.]
MWNSGHAEIPSLSIASGRRDAITAGARSTLTGLLRLLGSPAPALADGDAVPVPLRRLHAGATLFLEGGHADAVYFVQAGTFKLYRTAEDGYEQVLGFAGRAEVLGFDAVCSRQHPSAAQALEDAVVYALPIADILSPGPRVPALDQVLHLAVSHQLTRRDELAEVMAAVAAEVKLARFLLHLSARMAACGQSPRRLLLRMSRRDIASLLGVAHETVSRAF